MVIKTVVAFGIALTVLAWLLAVPYAPEATQVSMNSSAQSYRSMGYLPPSGTTQISSAIGHDIFEVPADDKLQEDMEMGGMDGMEMGSGDGMEMGSGDGMAMGSGDGMAMGSGDGMAMGSGDGMEIGSGDSMVMDSMSEKNHSKEGEMDAQDEMAEQPMKMDSDSSMAMSPDPAESMAMMEGKEHGEDEESEAGHAGGEGLTIIESPDAIIDKTIEIGMTEWAFDIENAMVMKGETVRLVVTNNGNTPHEFMLMSMPGMKAINYRLQRADWNLLEHEALFEVPVMMPGDTVEAVLKVENSGMWMFMCMFPYHMQMGMMGRMMTPDRMGMMSDMMEAM